MSRENVELVRLGIGFFNLRELDALLEMLHPEIELTPGIGPLGVGTIRGREAARRFWAEELPQDLDELKIEPLAFEDLGDVVLVDATYTALSPGSGMEVHQTFATVYLVEGGLIRVIHDFTTREEALEAVGLS